MNGGDAGSQHPGGLVNRRQFLGATSAAAATAALGVSASASTSEGRELWRAEVNDGDPVRNAPTVVDGTVYLLQGRQLEAFEASTGESLLDDPESTNTLHGTTAAEVHGESVYDARSGDVAAFDANTGDRRWITEIDENGRGAPAVDGDTVYALGSSTDYSAVEDKPTAHALDAETGDHVWQVDLVSNGNGGSNNTSPTLVDGVLYTDLYDQVTAIDTETGEQYWLTDTSSTTTSTTVADGTVIVGTRWEHLNALDAETGDVVWQYTDMDDTVRSHPTVADGTVYVTGADYELHALDLETGERQWRSETGSVYNGPTVVGDTVFVASYDGEIFAFDAADGEEVWSHQLDEEPQRSSPIVVDGTLFVGTDGGHVVALDAGVDGSSDGSRVLLGTHNHHDDLRRDRESLDPVDTDVGADESDESGDDGDSGDEESDSDGSDEEDSGTEDSDSGTDGSDGDDSGTEESGGSEPDAATGSDGDSPNDSEGNGTDAAASDGDSDTTGSDESAGSDDGLPGFGIGAGLAALGGTAYAIRSGNGDEEPEG